MLDHNPARISPLPISNGKKLKAHFQRVYLMTLSMITTMSWSTLKQTYPNTLQNNREALSRANINMSKQSPSLKNTNMNILGYSICTFAENPLVIPVCMLCGGQVFSFSLSLFPLSFLLAFLPRTQHFLNGPYQSQTEQN